MEAFFIDNGFGSFIDTFRVTSVDSSFKIRFIIITSCLRQVFFKITKIHVETNSTNIGRISFYMNLYILLTLMLSEVGSNEPLELVPKCFCLTLLFKLVESSSKRQLSVY